MVVANLILDIILVVALALLAIVGWKRGFIGGVLKTFAGLFSVMLSFWFFEAFALVLKEKYVLGFVKEKVTLALTELTAGYTPETMTDSVPEALRNAAAFVGIDLMAMAESAIAKGQDVLTQFAETASQAISQFLSSVVAFVLLFLIFYFVLRVLSGPLNALIMKLPVIGKVNQVLGSMFGLLAAILLCWIFVQLVGFLDVTMRLGFIEVPDAWIGGIFYRFHIFS